MILGWTLVLALVQIMLTAQFRTRETGLSYNMSARDAMAPPMGKITARLHRAQSNLFETLPLFATAILIAHTAARENSMTLHGAWTYLIARVIYIPLYAFGVPVIRTLTWGASLIGLAMILYVDLLG